MRDKEYVRVAQYESEESDIEKENEKPEESTKRTVKKWLYKQTFQSADDAREWIKSEGIWAKFRTNDTYAGCREDYRCNKVPKRGPQCACAIHLIYNADNFQVTAFITDAEHNHDELLEGRQIILVSLKNKYRAN